MSDLTKGALAIGLPDEWRKLWDATPGALAFNHPDWLLPWWATLGKGTEPYVTAVRNGGDLHGVAPLTRHSTPLGSVIKPAGEGVSDYTDWLLPAAPDQHTTILGQLADAVATESDWVGMVLPGWRNESDARLVARRLSKAGRRVRVLPGLPCPFVSMPDGFDAYYRSRGSRARYNVRSRERRLGQHGLVRYEHLTADDAPRGLEDAMALHARRWQGQHTSTVFSSSPAGRAFYRASIPTAVRQGFADLAVLKLDEQIIASAIGFQHGQEYGYYMPAWHPVYQTYAPSTLLLVHLMEHASARGALTFDFMLGDEPYKAAWATSQARVHTIVAAGSGATGHLWLFKTLGLQALRERARRSTRLMAIRRHGLGGITRSTDKNR